MHRPWRRWPLRALLTYPNIRSAASSRPPCQGRASRSIAPWGAALLLICASSAKADDTHYQDIVVGGRALTLGGAYTALSNDSSGLYYNPAGLVDVGYADAQISTSLYGFERVRLDNRPAGPGVPSLDTAFTDLVVIPAAAGFADSIGERDANGLARHAYGATIIVPSYRSASPGSGSGDGTDQDAGVTYRHRVTDRSIWAGLGYAYRLNDILSFGVSAFYVLRTVNDSEQLTNGANGDSVPFQTITSDVSFASGSIVAVGGAKLRLPYHWTMGASISTPSVRVNSSGSIQTVRVTSDPTNGVSSVARTQLDGLRSNAREAARLRVGVARSTDFWTISADVTAHAPVGYQLVDVPADVRARLPFTVGIDRKAIVNFNVGAEIMPLSWLSLAGGFYTDFSSARRLPANPTVDAPPRVNLLGGTFGIGYVREHLVTRLGALYSAGNGKDVLPTSDLSRLADGSQTFETRRYSQSFFYVFLSTEFRF